MRVLVAEDDPGLRDVLVQGLEDEGYNVDAVERGDDEIERLRFYEYDVAVLDWPVPGRSGLARFGVDGRLAARVADPIFLRG
jgi:two-component system, response regulator, stage 0 sporulation protein F